MKNSRCPKYEKVVRFSVRSHTILGGKLQLTISTLEALFRGRKDLFEGLYVYDQWDWNRKYPVIRIDWMQISHKTPEKVEKDLPAVLRYIANIGIIFRKTIFLRPRTVIC
jgi:hypothetical protein